MITKVIAILFTMIFLHIVDDFYLQGLLAKMKQRQWWIDNVPDKDLYKNDWLIALFAHGFSWSFMVHLPILVYILLNPSQRCDGIIYYAIMMIGNMLIHMRIDHEKCNNLTISLVRDQLLHLVQIFCTWITLIAVFVSGRI